MGQMEVADEREDPKKGADFSMGSWGPARNQRTEGEELDGASTTKGFWDLGTTIDG